MNEITWLTIRERRTLAPDADAEVDAHVDCPRKGGTVDFRECQRCGHGEIYFVNSTLQRTRLYCTHAPPVATTPRACTIDANTSVRAVMSDRFTCVREEVALDAIVTLFLEEGVTAVPVVDANGRPLGMISKTDILRDVRERGSLPEVSLPRDLRHGFHVEVDSSVCAGDVMTPLVFAISETATIAQAVPLMAYERIHHAPVVGEGEKVVGVLSSMDLMRFLTSVLVAPESKP